MKQPLNTVLQAVEACRDTILAAERHIWKNPETGFREWKTHAYLKSKYEELGYTITEAGNIPGFWTDIDTGRPGPCIAVFGELDALIVPAHPECDPETGAVHACGHHCQSAALLGVAAALKAPGVLDGLSGSVRLIAVPAEESEELDFRRQLNREADRLMEQPIPALYASDYMRFQRKGHRSAYGMPAKLVQGDDPIAVYEAAKELTDYIRAGNGPAVLEVKCYRWRGHFEGDQCAYRDKDVADREIRKDCLANLEKIALEQGALTAEDIDAMRAELAAELEAAVVFGENSPEPDPDRIFEGLYA